MSPAPLIRLTRHDVDLDPDDLDGVRTWLMDAVRTEIKLRGTPHPRLVLVGDGYVETLDLDALMRQGGGADPGATFQALRGRGGVQRSLVVMLGYGLDDETGEERTFGLVFEERTAGPAAQRCWWSAMLLYHRDPESGLGVPQADWQPSNGETRNPAELPPFLAAFAAPPPGAVPARVLEPARPVADVGVRFGDLAPGEPLPEDALTLVELVSRMVVPGLLSGRLRGAIVLRLHERAWEAWQLPGSGPASVTDLVRYVANVRQPQADAIALVQVAIRPEDEPPAPGVQIIAEKAGQLAETWSPLAFPDGPDGTPEVTQVLLRGPEPVGASGMWLGIDPEADIELTSTVADA